MANFQISECPRGMLVKVHSMGPPVAVDGSFLGHHLVDGRMALLFTTLLCRSHSAGHVGKGELEGCGEILNFDGAHLIIFKQHIFMSYEG
jgi:hypothetical protein